ncbi:DUF1987 domain-containing protein [Sulfurimonas sp. SAG-AH-194-I05]|nr:DUF1987 domain-containing protein [Sulfurimonas sp. SAG-AH-194-I05]MDF1875061.1 DUF1987 domain-containing protein [Sulfurimonas sp. SAG-AH-194-I05]
MQSLNIEATENSPKVSLDFENGVIIFEGKSYPENTFEFYEPISKWLEKYFNGNAKETTTVEIKLSYFNSATSQILFDLFDIINDGESHNLVINWYYDASKKSGLKDYEDYAEEFEDLNIKAIEF